MNNFLSSVSFSSLLSSVLSAQEKNKDKDKRFRPLYDIPYMFEAREFLRKKLIGKKVSLDQTCRYFESPKRDVITGEHIHALRPGLGPDPPFKQAMLNLFLLCLLI